MPFKKILILFILIILLSGCSLPFGKRQSGANNMNAAKKKILMVVSPIDFRDKEYFEPRAIFEKAGMEVKTASIQSGTAKGADGGEVKIDLTVSDVNISDFDAVVFVGGPGMAQIVADDSLQALAKKFYNAGKLTTAICVAPSILARAGILDGKKATSFDSVKEDLKNGKADYTGNKVEIDGKIITANGPEAAEEFGEKIVEALK
jgi:protease I